MNVYLGNASAIETSKLVGSTSSHGTTFIGDGRGIQRRRTAPQFGMFIRTVGTVSVAVANPQLRYTASRLVATELVGAAHAHAAISFLVGSVGAVVGAVAVPHGRNAVRIVAPELIGAAGVVAIGFIRTELQCGGRVVAGSSQ